MQCGECNGFFRNEECFTAHKTKTTRSNSKSICEKYKRCDVCNKLYKPASKHKHDCRFRYCIICKSEQMINHVCCIQKPRQKITPSLSNSMVETAIKCNEIINDDSLAQETKRLFMDDFHKQNNIPTHIDMYDPDTHCKKIIKRKALYMDFECRQDEGIHIPNLVVIQKSCELCEEREVTEVPHCVNCKDREQVFRGEDTLDLTCEYLFSGENRGYTVFCHNFKGYDGYFILDYVNRNPIPGSRPPQIIYNGGKILSLDVPWAEMKFLDSLNFMAMPLAKLPGCFNISDVKKGYFPHFFNMPSNYEYGSNEWEGIPDTKFYDPDGMDPKSRIHFEKWHAEKVKEGYHFNFWHEIELYCRDDVRILRKSVYEFRKLFMEITNIDPFNSITIASACNMVFREDFLEEGSIGIIPPQG